jgi:hypothetical protein
MAKRVTIEATFPELTTPRMYQCGHGTGSTVRTAMCAAVRNLLKQPKLKHQRFTMLSATVSIGTITEEATQCEKTSE